MRIYKICTKELWEETESTGVFSGMSVDIADGYVHFSTAEQQGETARKYFAGQKGLMLLTVEAETLGEALKWEASSSGTRSGQFPHLYGPLLREHIISAEPFDAPE
jgi:uncharacterized protein (DUF952 family)